MTNRARSILASVLVALAAPALTSAAPSAVPAKVEFNRDVRPILSDNCFACHGFDPKTRKGKVRLDTAAGAVAEYKGNRPIVPGDLAASEAWSRIVTDDADSVMPPPDSHKKLSADQKAILKRWIEQGAVYQQHWAFEPIAKSAVPPAAEGSNPIDAFLRDRLKAEGLTPTAEADKPTLTRRAAFALTGLPPTPAEVDAFAADVAPGAYERMVDRYLASPRFGEEMARHWLDVARYGDTHGLHLDNERQMWAYRDYVVRSFNEDKPFDRLTVEQLAGDLLPAAGKSAPTQEQLVATGFNRCNVTTSEGGSIDAEYAYRYAVDRASTTAEAWLGLTAGCAVCHDHKFDPITAKDFYSLYAFFNSAADPAMDGNAINTRPTVKLTTPKQDEQIAKFERNVAVRQAVLDVLADTYAYADPALATPKPPARTEEAVWLDDEFPAGAKVVAAPGQPTQWVSSVPGGAAVFSGSRALKRSDAGLAQDSYSEGAAPLTIPGEAVLFAHVYVDPADPPKTLMLQYHRNGVWAHRAVWGDYDAIGYGKPKTTEKVQIGPVPPAGKWVKLEVPAAKLGLNPGDLVSGFAVTQFGGTVYWDKVGVVGRSDPAADPAQSLSAWWKPRANQPNADAPPEVAELLKAGPAKVTTAADRRLVRNFYLQTANAGGRPLFGKLAAEMATIRAERTAFEGGIPITFVFGDSPKPKDAFVMIRGQYDQPGEKVGPASPAFLPPMRKADPATRATRLDLANWLVSPEQPLTARVTVNRFWQQFFGAGLVTTAADFGSQGTPPTHPELLDWLAATFREPSPLTGQAWDVKALVRQMVTSAAFRQSSAVTPDVLNRDPANKLFARGPRFRLDAEQIRDNVLFVSGLMNDRMGGPGARTYQPPNIWEPVGFVGSNTRVYVQDHGPDLYRRSLYTFLKRTAPAPFLSNFDAPSREQSCTRRERSNTPLQALQLMNDVQHVEAARALAERMVAAGPVPADRIIFAFRTVLSRQPEAEELAIVERQLFKHLDRYKADEAAAKLAIGHGESKAKGNVPPAELAAYALVANMVLNLDETLTRN